MKPGGEFQTKPLFPQTERQFVFNGMVFVALPALAMTLTSLFRTGAIIDPFGKMGHQLKYCRVFALHAVVPLYR